ncbi:MAG: hypothetical protein QM785_01345 [Pyrinomonadaceae bacterium]
MKTKLIITLAAITMCACGGVSSNSANNANSSSLNTSNRTAVTKEAETPVPVLEPTTMSAYDVVGLNYKKEDEGRIVTVTGGKLEAIEYDSLRISDINGGFYCTGSFSEYQSMKTRIDDLRYKHQSPTVTVKGQYTKSSYSPDRVSIKNCILTDLKR